jgi:hypothetical protein
MKLTEDNLNLKKNTLEALTRLVKYEAKEKKTRVQAELLAKLVTIGTDEKDESLVSLKCLLIKAIGEIGL